jgi:hypothetical protein
MARLKNNIISLLFIFIFSCCSSNDEQKKIVASWIDKEIIFPDDLQFQIQKDFLQDNILNADYKIVTYVDSANCMPCQMKLNLWNEVINEFNSIPDIQVGFLMVVNSRKRSDIETSIEQYNYNNLVCINESGSFDKANNFPKDRKYHTFLLDENNRVKAIGNPATNPKIKELYESLILKDLGVDSIAKNTLCRNNARNLGLVNTVDTLTIDFELNNTCPVNYTIQKIIPSCDCVSAFINTNVIPPGKTLVTVKYVPDNKAGVFSRYVEIFLLEKDNPERLTIFGVNK